MDLNDFQSIHIIGCGGAGCAPLTRILMELGFHVSGSDMISNANTEKLKALGISVALGQNEKNVPVSDSTLVIRTSAANENNPERQYAEQQGIPIILRGEALALLMKKYRIPIAISGSHGKTSVTAMIAWTLHNLGKNPGIMIGGDVPDWNFNGTCGNNAFFVTEADESDGTHALLHPGIGIVTNLEDDHAWSVGGIEALEKAFSKFAFQSRKLIYGLSPVTGRLFQKHPNATAVDTEHIPSDIPDSFPHFVRLDMLFALYALKECGIPYQNALSSLCKFPGVERRLSVRHSGAIQVIEDYAHHPTELRESIRAISELYPNKRLVIVFQPHRYARLERYFHDFIRELSRADQIFITPVFAAWTGQGKYTSNDLASAVRGISLHGNWNDMGYSVASMARHGDVIAIIGAGDLPQILPSLIKNLPI